jgi:hypothetical protein
MYDAPYVRKWIAIAKACSSTTFYVYTRSWRVKAMLPALTELAKCKNVRMWWSTDKDTHAIDGAPPRVRNVRVAHFVADQLERVPAYADLVFRDQHKPIEKYRNGRLVCPAENGVQYQFKMTCSDCKLCTKQRCVPKKARVSLPVLV